VGCRYEELLKLGEYSECEVHIPSRDHIQLDKLGDARADFVAFDAGKAYANVVCDLSFDESYWPSLPRVDTRCDLGSAVERLFNEIVELALRIISCARVRWMRFGQRRRLCSFAERRKGSH
jgi:hypothetical protein